MGRDIEVPEARSVSYSDIVGAEHIASQSVAAAMPPIPFFFLT